MATPGRDLLKDKTAVVTGASSGIGHAIALMLRRQGYRLHLVGRDKGALAEAHGDHGADAVMHVADLADPDGTAALARRLSDEIDGLDLLVHSAGVFSAGPVASSPVEALDRQFQVNLRAPWVLTQALLGALLQREGQIVFVNSSAGAGPHAVPETAAYAATKQALRTFADVLRAEVNPNGVRVLSVFPGRTATPMQAMIHAQKGRPYGPDLLLQPEDIAASVMHAIDLPPTAELTDLMIRPMRKGD